jgi:hypothetical protein
VKVDDDMMSATRVLCMDLRKAKTAEHFPARLRAVAAAPIADGTDFDLFSPA